MTIAASHGATPSLMPLEQFGSIDCGGIVDVRIQIAKFDFQ